MAHTNEVELVTNTGWDERILVCRNGELVYTTIVVSRRYVVIVDTMINEATAGKLLELAQPYLGEDRTLLVVNTHADYDHCWGNQLFAEVGVPIIGRFLSVPIFSQPDSVAFLEQMRNNEPGIFGAVIPTPPTVLFDETLTIDGGDLTLELFPTPGHTLDHLSIYIPEISTLLAADAAEVPYPVARTAAGLPAMRRSLARLAGVQAETVLYCHAPVMMGAQLLHDNIAYFDKLEAACRAALERGVPADPPAGADVIALVGLPYAAAVPDGEAWQNVHGYYRSEGHTHQLRQMLAALSGG
ncbi:MAG: MBL fold metallo-hydrolase [Anaerolineae bacterium]|nr:MBL fold metallo-hydrolase [Anaerolineae bacterium]